ncbi:MAG: hypothetical protein LBH77_05220 [Tannerella sp.]|nr:hypothetical protein [Tannerella sp.]
MSCLVESASGKAEDERFFEEYVFLRSAGDETDSEDFPAEELPGDREPVDFEALNTLSSPAGACAGTGSASGSDFHINKMPATTIRQSNTVKPRLSPFEK